MTQGRQTVTRQLLLHLRFKAACYPVQAAGVLSFPASTLLCSLRQDTCPLGLALNLTMVKAVGQKPQTCGCL